MVDRFILDLEDKRNLSLERLYAGLTIGLQNFLPFIYTFIFFSFLIQTLNIWQVSHEWVSYA